jgi:hypothetical protein
MTQLQSTRPILTGAREAEKVTDEPLHGVPPADLDPQDAGLSESGNDRFDGFLDRLLAFGESVALIRWLPFGRELLGGTPIRYPLVKPGDRLIHEPPFG